MPASTYVDNISSSLKNSFQSMQNKAVNTAKNGADSLESGLASASAKRGLLSNVTFDSPIKHMGGVTFNSNGTNSFKNNFIFLNPLKKGQNGVNNTQDSSSSNNAEPDKESPPRPKITFFPLTSIDVGYKANRGAGAGMYNMGNTCYLNSTLQALFHTPSLFNYLTSGSHKAECRNSQSNGFIQSCMICALSATLRDTMHSNVMRPNKVYEKLKSICKHMVHGRQEDAHEFLRYLIESLQKSYLVSKGAPKSLDNPSKETTPFNQIFGGYMRQDVTCLKCKYVSITFQHFMDLLLDIRQASNIDEALSVHFRAERIGGNGGGDGANMYKCDKCKTKVPARKRCFIERPPVVLCIQLKRFSLLGGKISKPVQLCRKIDVSNYVKKKDAAVSHPPLQYKLVSMITHVGPSPNCGHYTAIGEAGNGQFFQFDDSSVRPVSINQAMNTASYVAFYEMTRPTKQAWIHKEDAIPHKVSTTGPKPSNSQKPCTVTSNGVGPSPIRPRIIPVNGVNKTSNGPNKLGVVASAKPQHTNKTNGLVPYDDDDSDEEQSKATPSPMTNGHKIKSSSFVPRSVAMNALKRSQEPRPDSPASILTAANVKSAEPGASEPVSGSGAWRVTESEHHDPSVNSDNSAGSTSGSWKVTSLASTSSPRSLTPAPSNESKPTTPVPAQDETSWRPSLPNQTSVTSSSTASSSSVGSTPEHRASKRSSSIEEYEADLDRGRTKKVKSRHSQGHDDYSRPSFNSKNSNPFQSYQNRSQSGNNRSSNNWSHNNSNRSQGYEKDHYRSRSFSNDRYRKRDDHDFRDKHHKRRPSYYEDGARNHGGYRNGGGHRDYDNRSYNRR